MKQFKGCLQQEKKGGLTMICREGTQPTAAFCVQMVLIATQLYENPENYSLHKQNLWCVNYTSTKL